MSPLRSSILAATLTAGLAAAPAAASEVYLGASFHGVDTPFTLEAGERGHDAQMGFRSERIEGLGAIGKPSAYVHAQASLDGETSLIAAGLSWKIGDRFYARPGIGLALHNDRIAEYDAAGRRLDLGSRVLFEPELALGARLRA
jgi:hypothetical protein